MPAGMSSSSLAGSPQLRSALRRGSGGGGCCRELSCSILVRTRARRLDRRFPRLCVGRSGGPRDLGSWTGSDDGVDALAGWSVSDDARGSLDSQRKRSLGASSPPSEAWFSQEKIPGRSTKQNLSCRFSKTSSQMATSLKSRFDYDVFPSFGQDCSQKLASYVYVALTDLGIRCFKDSEDLIVGQEIWPAIVNAIARSRIHVLYFSVSYADSMQCLNELEEIMKQWEGMRKLLVPIFYGVESDEVMRQVKEYGEALQRHMDQGIPKSKVKAWRFSLCKAVCSLPKVPEDPEDPEDGQRVHYVGLIEAIVKVISTELTKFDVFLNFRGKDVHEGFIKSLSEPAKKKSLYEALTQKGINAFVDSEKLRKGEDFPPALMDAIEQSRMYVVIFSENYAESSWCLDELVEILESKDIKQRPMLPVFYKVEPAIVRYQTQSYREALANHEIKYGKHPEVVKKWKEALFKASNVNGVCVHDGNDSIPGIVKEIERILGEIGCKPE